MSISLSSLLKVDVSTYENPSMDTVFESMENDLDECGLVVDDVFYFETLQIKKITVDGLWLVDVDSIRCEDNLDFDNFKLDIWKSMQMSMETACNLKEIFWKYWLEYGGMYFYTPKAYNYEGDSLELRLKTMRENYDLVALGLEDLIKQYIDNERQESYDWYCSFEPTNFDEVGIDDYCTLWAILHKERVFDILKNTLQDFVDEWYGELVWWNTSQMYSVPVPNGKTRTLNGGEVVNDYDRVDHKLDYDNKILLRV